MNPRLQTALKVIAPIAVLTLAGLGALALASMRTPPQTSRVEAAAPVVRTTTVRLEDLQLRVTSQGAVRPRTQSRVVPEVGGRVVWMSSSFVEGGFFDPGQPLLRLDTSDYEQAVVRAESEVAAAKLRLAQEEAEARLARREWEELGEGEAPQLTLREPQLENARASVAATEAALQRARRDLERTEIEAPYAGRVREKDVDVGQYVTQGSNLGLIYATDRAEVRLPLPDEELAFLDLPVAYRDQPAGSGPEVVLSADFAGRTHEWRGRIERTEGVIDEDTRMVHVVAVVRDPYGRSEDPDRPPLAVGLFVQAEIAGLHVERIARLPRSVLRDDGRVPVLTPEGRLELREVEVLRTTRDDVLIRDGLRDGERVVLSSLTAPVEGMLLRTAEEVNR